MLGAITLVLFFAAAPGDEPVLRYHEGFDDVFLGGSLTAPEVYPNWRQVTPRAGFPPANVVRLLERADPTRALTGAGAIAMETHILSAGIETEPGTLGGAFSGNEPRGLLVSADYGYILRAHVRIFGNERGNAAQLVLRWFNENGALRTETISPPLTDADEWTEMLLDVPTIPADASYAQIQLRFGGPETYALCYWDEVELRAVPKVRVEPEGRVQPIYREGETPRLFLRPPADADPPYSVTARLFAIDGTELPLPALQPEARDWRLELPGLAPGYYELVSRLERDGEPYPERIDPILVRGPAPFGGGLAHDYGVTLNPYRADYQRGRTAETDPPPGAGIAELVDVLRVGHAKIYVWDRAPARSHPEPTPTDIQDLVQILLDREMAPGVGVFGAPPSGGMEAISPELLDRGPVAVLTQPESLWSEGVNQFSLLLRDEMAMWQLGGDGDRTISTDQNFRQAFENLGRVLARRGLAELGYPLESPTARVPVRASFFSIPIAEESDVPSTVPEGAHFAVTLPSLDRTRPLEAQRERAARLARLLVRLRAAHHDLNDYRVYADASARDRHGLLDPEGRPTAALLTFAFLSQLLTEARPAAAAGGGALHFFEDPIQDVIFERDGIGIIVAWTDGPPARRAVALGPETRVFDATGRSIVLEQDMFATIGGLPVVITGADVRFVRTLRSLAVNQADLPHRLAEQPRVVSVVNEFETPLTSVRLRAADLPPGWSIQPPLAVLPDPAPGASTSVSIGVELPQNASAAAHEIVFELEFLTGGRAYRGRVTRLLTVNPEIEPRIVENPDGTLEIRLVNHSERVRDGITVRVDVLHDLPFEIRTRAAPGEMLVRTLDAWTRRVPVEVSVLEAGGDYAVGHAARPPDPRPGP